VRWPAVVNQAGLLHGVARALINLPVILVRNFEAHVDMVMVYHTLMFT